MAEEVRRGAHHAPRDAEVTPQTGTPEPLSHFSGDGGDVDAASREPAAQPSELHSSEPWGETEAVDLPFDDPTLAVEEQDVRPIVVNKASLPTAILAALLGAGLALAGGYAAVQSGLVTIGARAAQPTVGPTGPKIVDAQVSAPDWAAVAAAVTPSTVSVRATGSGDGSQGAGFILDSEGHVLTNTHVVAGQSDVSVILNSGVIVEAGVVGMDESTDIAVLKMEAVGEKLVPASLGDSEQLVVGQPVAAVGNPLGLSQSVSVGIISALDRPVSTVESEEAGRDTVTNAIQTDAATNEGNSGGALVDAEGRVVGVTSALARETSVEAGDRPAGIGFAIPINLAKKVAEQLIDSGVAAHASLDVTTENVWVRADTVSQLGAHVTGVATGSSAARGGILVDDTIVALNGAPIVSTKSLIGTVREYQPGDIVTITVVRGTNTLDLDVPLGD